MDIVLRSPHRTTDKQRALPTLAHRWLRRMVRSCRKPVIPSKPKGVYIPDRLWRRQSALYMCLQESRSKAEP
ncbi:MAG: hypothetical protein N0C89_04985 [Candidatus Thiodiazotropha endolucinida]|uniref:Uncharacterized protein n=1 Tax=Candidatus Thiodiazotropha taylori TaxID=2792791 RepID=A0A9E4NIK3_9GAMM|nr:hypothetical protein [Candidatus Thiodiazotropha taylori]MCG8093415.1 hypothetical protein [Candidatus Thiodiazotropha endolucinida]MCG7977943.1 hypothetical protein [Candidatus Thiodiazotropha taylori]MCG8046140.1 hypothetical protein [Candidatus Thiodiazotropha taylori]MCG8059440.1 hypothetical protein [Candidatus Thiodiazotropha taylori]